MGDFDVRRCRREDYKEFLDVLNEAFGHDPQTCWFQQNIDNCTPYPETAGDDQIARHVIAAERPGGAIMGGVGAYPFELVVSEDAPGGMRFSLPSIGIGQVCCIPKYRNRGVMSVTLKTILDDAVRDGAILGFLGGDRYRYGRFGFDYGGAAVSLDFARKRLQTATSAKTLETRPAGEADITLLNDMYETYASYTKRDPANWKMHMNRPSFSWVIGELGGKIAYLSHNAGKTRIVELRGDPDTALAMVLHHMETNELDRISVSAPLAPGRDDPLYELLRAASSHTRVQPCGMNLLALLSPEKLYDIFSPLIAHVGLTPGSDEEKCVLIKYLISAPGHPYPKATLRGGLLALRPLSIWLPEADNV